MSKSIAYKHYLRALSRWPVDALRPETQFQNAVRRRIDKRFLPASASKDSATSTTNEKAELEQANALYSLLENRYSNKYPVSSSFMRPASNPTYYKDLVKELEEAPARTWWGQMTNRWKGFLRFS